jgi:hypothetical protein
LQEVGLSGGIDVPAILGPAISDLSESELEELARQLSGPLMDTTLQWARTGQAALLRLTYCLHLPQCSAEACS